MVEEDICMMDSKIIKKMWVTNSACIGLIVSENSEGEREIHCCNVPGYNEEQDARYVMENGSTVHPGQLQELLDALSKPEGS